MKEKSAGFLATKKWIIISNQSLSLSNPFCCYAALALAQFSIFLRPVPILVKWVGKVKFSSLFIRLSNQPILLIWHFTWIILHLRLQHCLLQQLFLSNQSLSKQKLTAQLLFFLPLQLQFSSCWSEKVRNEEDYSSLDAELKPIMENEKGHQQLCQQQKWKITEEEKRKSLILKASKCVKDLWQCLIRGNVLCSLKKF